MAKFYIFLALSVFVIRLNAQTTIEVEITNLKNNKGFVLVQLLDTSKNQVLEKKCTIENGLCTFKFTGVKQDKYAIRYFHDENANGELDKNWMGIPSEGYGFSNDAYGKYGPKDFEEWLFKVDNDIVIKLKTMYL